MFIEENTMSLSGKNTRAIHTDYASIARRLAYHQKLMHELEDYGHTIELASTMAYNIVRTMSDAAIKKAIKD